MHSTRFVFDFLNDKHLNTQELVQTDFRGFMGIGYFTRANMEQTKEYVTNKRPGCQKTGILKMHCRPMTKIILHILICAGEDR